MDRKSSGKAEADLKKSFAGNNSRNVLQSSGSLTNVSGMLSQSCSLSCLSSDVLQFEWVHFFPAGNLSIF